MIPPPEGKTDIVRFGATVTVREKSGEESTYRIVGVDETDMDQGWVSWLSPVARALMNKKVGERVHFKIPAGETELEILRSITIEVFVRHCSPRLFQSRDASHAPSGRVSWRDNLIIDCCNGFRRYHQERHGLRRHGRRADDRPIWQFAVIASPAVGDFKTAKAKTVIDASGLAVAPGFINMLSWSTESLIEDGRSQSEIRQGVTTEIMGEGESMGPVNDRVREKMLREQKDIKYEIKWKTLAEYLQLSRKARRFLQCRLVHRRDDDSRVRHRVRRQSSRRRSSSTRCASWSAGNGSGRARHRHVADLSAGVLREDGRADRAVQSRGEISGQIHFAHAQRRESVVRSARRTDPHQPRSEHSRRDLSHQSRRASRIGRSSTIFLRASKRRKRKD